MLTYPARIEPDGEAFLVTFPDHENIVAGGATIEEALNNAEEALNGCLSADFERGFEITEPSAISGPNIHPVAVAPHIAVAILLRQRSEWEVLSEAIKNQALSYPVSITAESPYGKRYSIDGEIHTPDGRFPHPRIRTVWIEENDSQEWRLITAHPI